MDNGNYRDPWEMPDGRAPMDLRARDYRAAARNALNGFWTTALLVTFVAALLGGLFNSGPSFRFDLNINVDDTTLQEMSQVPGMTDTGYYDLAQTLSEITERFPFAPALFAFCSLLATVQFVIGGPVALGYSRFKLHRFDGQEAQMSDVFSAFDRFLDGLWMRVRLFLQILGWSLLFIIPGIIAAYRYALVPYLMAENPELSVGDAIERSKQLMIGRKWKLFCLQLSFIGWMLLCGLTLGIASLWISPYMEMAETAFYRNLVPAAN